PHAFGLAFGRSVYFFGVFLTVLSFARRKRASAISVVARILLVAGLLATARHFGWSTVTLLRGVFFPHDMVLYVCCFSLLSLWFFVKDPSVPNATFSLLALFSVLLAARLLLKMTPGGYPIYYNGPVLLAFLLALRPFFRIDGLDRRAVQRADLLLSVGCAAT